MKTIKNILYTATAFVLLGCSDFLEQNPQGILDEEQVKNAEQVEGLVTAAYASLGNDHYDIPFSLWPYGNVRSDDSYKGGGDENDIVNFHFYEISENIKTDFGEADGMWFNCFQAISRANSALSVLKSIDVSQYPNRDVRMGEMYFLRGHFYFILKEIFGHIPYVDEDTPLDDYVKVPNNLPNDELWALICGDFQKAYELLPASQPQIGRANKIAAAAYLSKAYLFKAFRQNEMNGFTGVDATDLNNVITYADVVLGSSYGLETDFAHNFLPGIYQNGRESIFAVQYSVSDGTMFGRLNFGDVLSLPMGLGCCDFHKPSQNLVNAFKTTNGLPQFDTYNNANYDSNTDSSDPRLFHTVAMPDFPWKYNQDLIYRGNWNRTPNVYGYYASLKENVDPSCDCFVNLSPFYGNSKNRIILRYADILLAKAEALVELGRESEALPLVNQLRERAAASTAMVSYAPNLSVANYVDGANCNWTQDFARQAVRWERRLEFAMEGQRFFDLVRWGVAEEVLNEYFASETPRRYYYAAARFNKNKDEYIPIPQQQISFTNGIYTQNPGW
ncbi:MAG: RagB/SusD family nutrient uptake outer membrane protein [Capnocytophaga sp.]|nr:RagB/SusD family nutrient uptake outer membrane protein [Capnocytophaga sp.]